MYISTICSLSNECQEIRIYFEAKTTLVKLIGGLLVIEYRQIRIVSRHINLGNTKPFLIKYEIGIGITNESNIITIFIATNLRWNSNEILYNNCNLVVE